MPNRAFRLLLSLSSVYISCITIFNVFIGSFGSFVNISLISTGLLSILQIVNLTLLYTYSSKLLVASGISGILLIASSVWTMIVFPYLLGQLIFGIIITLFAIGLVYVAKKDLAKRAEN